MASDLDKVHADLILINSKLHGICEIATPPVKPKPGELKFLFQGSR